MPRINLKPLLKTYLPQWQVVVREARLYPPTNGGCAQVYHLELHLTLKPGGRMLDTFQGQALADLVSQLIDTYGFDQKEADHIVSNAEAIL